ncbi:Phospholipid-transporting ATPase IB (ATPase class I type 8A member 2) (ML-1) (P4-ATPase flippase complex alpha subunit ATP8A2) [Durusdinium trenchii]|uniref:Phospholipid-transporting ATPase IB (ATPase class I type 8A member 2) (ML-1) (P4-ATPase flippase complex alpha subunit ATP8A2) n=1 Tax=Durusdinium trenchii TaxID=1381693 RepID=A0ABP0QWI2_9DINO
MVCIYTFYKNQVNVLITILSCAVNAFSGANVVNPWLMQCYNLLHCHLPIFIYGILDRCLQIASNLRIVFKRSLPEDFCLF